MHHRGPEVRERFGFCRVWPFDRIPVATRRNPSQRPATATSKLQVNDERVQTVLKARYDRAEIVELTTG